MSSVRESRQTTKTNSVEREVQARATVTVASARRGKLEEADRLSRVREGSLVVLDEAAHDPSLRFVLIAFLLFAVCLVLLVISLLSR